MYPTSVDAAARLAGTHTAGGRINVLHSGKSVLALTVTDGAVQAQPGRSIMRNLSCTVADATGTLTGSELGDVMSPYDAELAAYRGVLLSDNRTIEWFPLGIFQITNKEVGDYLELKITGQDRALIYQGGMTGAYAIPGGTKVEYAIGRLLGQRNSGLVLHSFVTGFTVGPLVFSADINVWDEAQKLAQAVGAWLYHDRNGLLILAPDVPTSPHPVTTLARGDGKLITATKAESSDNIHNVVVVVSPNADSGVTIRGVAEDADSHSPTYSRGRYGRRVVTVTNAYVSSNAQAKSVATTQLVRELGRTETSTVTLVPDPRIDCNDALVVHHPDKGLIRRLAVADAITYPLTVKDPMTIGLRKSIITQNGQVIISNAQVTTT